VISSAAIGFLLGHIPTIPKKVSNLGHIKQHVAA